MADSKMTLDEAMRLANGDYQSVDNAQLAEMNQVFADSFTAQDGSYTDDVKFAANSMQLEAEERIQKLEKVDNFEPGEIDGIIALADSLGFSSPLKDQAKALAEKAIKQKAELESKPNEGQEAPVYEVGDETPAEEAPQQEENLEAAQEGAESAAPEAPDAAESETSEEENADEQQLQAGENIPEDQAALEAFDKEYGIDIMTEEQLNKNAEFMDEMDRTFDPFAPDGQGNLVHPEFQEEFDAFESMVVTDDNGEPLSEEEQAEAKESLKQTAMFEAGMLTRGCAKGDSLEAQYKEALKSSLQRAVVSVGFADEVKGKSLDKEK